MEYLIECLTKPGEPWYIVGSDPSSAWAQNYMRRYQQRYPHCGWRVVESPSRVLVVCHVPAWITFAGEGR